MNSPTSKTQIAVVIPCYKVKKQILQVLTRIPAAVSFIFVVDDCCPEGSGKYLAEQTNDPRVKVIFHQQNQGVGGATVTGYQAALNAGAEIVVKIDGDGQMDPGQLLRLVEPILLHQADYVKANRFFSPQSLIGMPLVRLLGNSILSFVNKLSSGYWNIMDPTNGYTAIHALALKSLKLEQLDRRYFFESDMLFRLYTIRAVVKEVPLIAQYADESSSLNVFNTALTFPLKYLTRLFKRLLYAYFIRDFGVCSLQIIFGLLLGGFGGVFGLLHWRESIVSGIPATAGTVIVAALPFVLGFQLLLNALLFDASNIPKEPIHAKYY